MGDLTNQVHDWEPGIRQSGLFWTIPVPAEAVEADLAAGRARFRMEGVHIPDFHDFFSAVSPHPRRRPSVVDFDVEFTATGPQAAIRDKKFGFTGLYAPAELHIDFAARNLDGHVSYNSVSDGQLTVGGGMGQERNGIFFS